MEVNDNNTPQGGEAGEEGALQVRQRSAPGSPPPPLRVKFASQPESRHPEAKDNADVAEARKEEGEEDGGEEKDDFDFADDDVMLNLVNEQQQQHNGGSGIERRDSAWMMAHQAGQAVSEWLQRKDRERATPNGRPVSPPPTATTGGLPDPLLDPAALASTTSAGRKPPFQTSQRVKSVGFFSFSRYDTPSKEGWLTKQGGRVKNWKRRWFILSEDRLYYYKKPGDMTPLGFIPLSRCCIRITEMRRRGRRLRYSFELYDPLGVFCRRHPAFYIFADNEEELEEWIRALNLKVADSPMKNLRVEEPVIDIHPIERQGWLTKRGGIVKNWKRRWFVLRGNMLYYYRNTKIKTPLGFIPVDRCSVELLNTDDDFKKHGIRLPRRKQGFVFQITDPCSAFNRWHPSYYLMAETEEDMDEWIAAICTIKLLDFDASQITDSSPSESFRRATNEDEVLVQLSGEIDPDALARQYGMENKGPVASLPNSYRFKKTSSAPRNVISALGKQKGVTLNKRRFSLGSSSSSSGSASYSRTSSLSLSSFRLSLPEPLSTEASGELKGLPRGVDLFSDDGGVEGEDGDDEWEEKSIGLVWRNSYVAPRPHKHGGGIGVIDLDTSRESSLVMVEGEDDDDGDDNEEESIEDAEQQKKKKQQLQQQPRNVAFNREMKALARDQEKRMTAVVSMLNFLYKAVKKRSAKAAAAAKGTPAQVQVQSKAREEVLENLFNTTYDDLKYLEVLKELLQSDNDELVREDTIEEIMVGKFKGAEELGLPLSLFCTLKTAHQVRVVSSLMLDYLASLTSPILPHYRQIIALREHAGEQRTARLRTIIAQLDRPRHRILRRLLGLIKRIGELSALSKNGRALTVPQMAIVLAPYIIRPTSQSSEIDSGSVDDLGDTLIEPSKCIDSPKPIGFPLTPRRREIVRSDWTHITELITKMVADFEALFHHHKQPNNKNSRNRQAISEKTWNLLSSGPATLSSISSSSIPPPPPPPSAWVSGAKKSTNAETPEHRRERSLGSISAQSTGV